MAGTRLMDTINANEGRAFVTIGGRNRKLFELSKLTATAKIKVKSKQMLENRVEQHKPTGITISGSMTCYLMTSDWQEYVQAYKQTGRLEPITIQAVMEDPASAAGRSEILLREVIPSDIGLVNIDDSSDGEATWETDFVAGDWETLSKFESLQG